MHAILDFWDTWVFGGPWYVTQGDWLLRRHRSGALCHLDAMLSSVFTQEPRGAWGDFTNKYNSPKWHYIYG